MLWVLLALSMLCAFMLVYPYFIYPEVLRLLSTKEVVRTDGYRTSMTMLFCAYNEEAALPRKIENLRMLKARHPDLEILAFDDGSTDRTWEILSASSDVLTPLRGEGRNGKAHGMKLMARQSRSEVLVFTDANVILREDALDQLMAWYGSPKIGGVCGSLHYEGDSASVTASVGSSYWKLEEKIKREESRTGNVMGADGSIFSVRKALYPDFPDSVLDDLTVSMEVVFKGYRLIKAEDVVAYEHLVVARSEEFTRKVRIASRAYHTHSVLRSKIGQMALIDRFKYASHKLVRWFGGAFLIVGGASTLLLCFLLSSTVGLSVIAISTVIALIGNMRAHGPASMFVELAMALIATLLGVLRALRGRSDVIWNPAKSR